MATKGKKSHFYLNTSTLVSRLNTIIRNKIVFIELAGWIHEALVRVTKDQVKPWMFHCMEGRSSKFAVPRPEDAPFLKESPIDPAWVRAAAKHVVEKFKQVFDVVTDGGDAAGGRCVGVFEGLFGPKEDGPARASRDAALQKKTFDGGVFANAVRSKEARKFEVFYRSFQQTYTKWPPLRNVYICIYIYQSPVVYSSTIPVVAI